MTSTEKIIRSAFTTDPIGDLLGDLHFASNPIGQIETDPAVLKRCPETVDASLRLLARLATLLGEGEGPFLGLHSPMVDYGIESYDKSGKSTVRRVGGIILEALFDTEKPGGLMLNEAVGSRNALISIHAVPDGHAMPEVVFEVSDTDVARYGHKNTKIPGGHTALNVVESVTRKMTDIYFPKKT